MHFGKNSIYDPGMLILISPAKSLNENPETHALLSRRRLLDESARLVKTMQKQSRAGIARLMDLSPALAELNYLRFQNFPKNAGEAEEKPAVLMFEGDVYRNMTAREWNPEQSQFAQAHLRILSGLYGVLRPYDGIYPYRLEMGTALKVGRTANLVQFWGNRISSVLMEDLKEAGSRFILNLASIEYAQAVQKHALKVPWIDVDFRELRQGQMRTIALNSKRARGMMADLVIRNQLTDLDSVKRLEFSGYTLKEATDNRLLFCRES